MTRSISRAEVLDAPLIISNGLSVSSITHVLLVAVFMSLFLLVYVNFSNRVNTTRLNQLLTDQQRLLEKKDQMLLEREKLQMYDHTEQRATKALGFRLAKKAKVVTIRI